MVGPREPNPAAVEGQVPVREVRGDEFCEFDLGRRDVFTDKRGGFRHSTRERGDDTP